MSRRSYCFKLSAKLIKCVKSRVHYNATGLVCAVYEPAKPILINVSKQQSLVLLETHQPAGIKESCCESGAKYDTSTPSCLVLAALRVQAQDPKRDLK